MKINRYLLLIIVLIFVTSGYFVYIKNRKALNSKECYNLPESQALGPSVDSDVIDCLGYINIKKWLDCGIKDNPLECGYIYIYDSYHHMTFVNRVEKYFVDRDNKKVYVIGNIIYDINGGGGKNTFSIFVPIDGEYKLSYFNSVNDMPHYIVIASDTGNLVLYKTLDQIQETERKIF